MLLGCVVCGCYGVLSGFQNVFGVFWVWLWCSVWLLGCFELFSECLWGVLGGCYGVLSGFQNVFGVFWVVAMVF